MGMDRVEIVLEIEEAFDVAVADSEAEKIITPRDLIELVMAKARPPGPWSREQVSSKVREIVIEVLGCTNYREDA